MILLQIFHITIGLLFSLFIPGFLLSILVFKKLNSVKRIFTSISFSIIISILLLFILGGSKFSETIFGGITKISVYLGYILICISLLLLIKKNNNKKNSIKIFENDNEVSTKYKLKYFILIELMFLIILITFFFFKLKGLPYWIFWIIIISNGVFTLIAIHLNKSIKSVFILLLFNLSIISIYVFGLPEPFQFNNDTYFESHYSMELIKHTTWNPSEGIGIAKNYYGYNPAIHFINASISLTTNIDTFLTSKYILIYLIRIMITLSVFLISYELFNKNAYYSSLTTLFYITAHGVMNIFVSRRFIAAFFILLTIYFLLLKNNLNKKSTYPIIIILFLLIIISDHSNSYLFLCFLVAGYIFSKLLIIYNNKIKKTKIELFNIFSMRLILIYLIILLSWIFFIGTVFVQTDYEYSKQISSSVFKDMKTQTTDTLNIGTTSINNLISDVKNTDKNNNKVLPGNEFEKYLVDNNITSVDEFITQFSKLDPSQKEYVVNLMKDNNITSLENSINKLNNKNEENIQTPTQTILQRGAKNYNVNYNYERMLGYIAGGLFLLLSCIGFIYYILNKQTKNSKYYLIMLYFGIIGILGFILLGFQILSRQNVFTNTFFWFFSFLTCIFITYSIILLNKLIKYKKIVIVILIMFFSIILIGNILIDHGPSIVNRTYRTGTWSENDILTSNEVLKSAEWTKNNINDNKMFIGDTSIIRIYQTYFDIPNFQPNAFIKKYYLYPKSTTNSIKYLFQNETNYLILNMNYFSYPNLLFNRPLNYENFYKNMITDNHENIIYDNKKNMVILIN